MKPVVEAGGLTIAGRLEETSLSLEAGQLTCLVGPNGSGKTSLLHALAGVGDPKGSVTIGGVSPHGLPPEQRQRLLAYLPASRDVTWPLTALDLIRLGNPDPAFLPRVIEALDLMPLLDRRVDRMSTGERSRVLIARALAARSKLLLLDEPAANLDPLWQLRLMGWLRSEAQTNCQAALVAVHDLELAGSFADRLLIMDRRRIAADGKPAELLAGSVVPEVFGIERSDGRWREVVRPEDRRSWR